MPVLVLPSPCSSGSAAEVEGRGRAPLLSVWQKSLSFFLFVSPSFPCDCWCSALFFSPAFFPPSSSLSASSAPLALFFLCCVSPGACALTLLLCRTFHLQTVSGFPCWPLIVFFFVLFDYFPVNSPVDECCSLTQSEREVRDVMYKEKQDDDQCKDLRLNYTSADTHINGGLLNKTGLVYLRSSLTRSSSPSTRNES